MAMALYSYGLYSYGLNLQSGGEEGLEDRTRQSDVAPVRGGMRIDMRSSMRKLYVYNLMHLHMSIGVSTCASTSIQTCVHLHTSMQTCVHLHTSMQTCVHLRTSVQTCVHLYASI